MVLCRGTRRVRETRKRGGGQISKGGPPLTFWNSPWNWNNPWGFKDPISASHIRDCTGFTTRCQLTKGPYNRSSNNLLQPVSICKSVNLQCSIHNKRVVIACAVGMMGHKNNPDQNVKKSQLSNKFTSMKEGSLEEGPLGKTPKTRPEITSKKHSVLTMDLPNWK